MTCYTLVVPWVLAEEFNRPDYNETIDENNSYDNASEKHSRPDEDALVRPSLRNLADTKRQPKITPFLDSYPLTEPYR